MQETELHRAADALLAERKYRFTATRRRLIDAVAVADRPLTVAEIVAVTERPSSSVYRNLAVLVDAGLLAAIPGFDRQERFEIAAALTAEHRHHLVCVRCGVVADYVPPPQLECLVALLTPPLAEANGFELQGHTLDLLGVCAGCSTNGMPSA